jgi:hypothetical protein
MQVRALGKQFNGLNQTSRGFRAGKMQASLERSRERGKWVWKTGRRMSVKRIWNHGQKAAHDQDHDDDCKESRLAHRFLNCVAAQVRS